jgi:hypothetical protein
MTELEAAKRHVVATLTGAAGLVALLPAGVGNTKAIYDHPAPQTTSFPCVTVLHLSDVHHHAGQSHVGAIEFRFLVRAAGESASKVTAYAVLKQIDLALHKAASSQGSGTWECDSYRVAFRELGGLDHGRRLQETGAVYSVWVRPIS